MNIFVTDKCPYKSAKRLDNKRVIKMALESTQLLCTALYHHGIPTPYKPTHANHPCSVWARISRSNWLWLYEHAIALCREYELRYGKKHKCLAILSLIKGYEIVIDDFGLTEFANVTPYKGNVHTAYLQLLNDKWDSDKREPTWERKAV